MQLTCNWFLSKNGQWQVIDLLSEITNPYINELDDFWEGRCFEPIDLGNIWWRNEIYLSNQSNHQMSTKKILLLAWVTEVIKHTSKNRNIPSLTDTPYLKIPIPFVTSAKTAFYKTIAAICHLWVHRLSIFVATGKTTKNIRWIVVGCTFWVFSCKKIYFIEQRTNTKNIFLIFSHRQFCVGVSAFWTLLFGVDLSWATILTRRSNITSVQEHFLRLQQHSRSIQQSALKS